MESYKNWICRLRFQNHSKTPICSRKIFDPDFLFLELELGKLQYFLGITVVLQSISHKYQSNHFSPLVHEQMIFRIITFLLLHTRHCGPHSKLALKKDQTVHHTSILPSHLAKNPSYEHHIQGTQNYLYECPSYSSCCNTRFHIAMQKLSIFCLSYAENGNAFFTPGNVFFCHNSGPR